MKRQHHVKVLKMYNLKQIISNSDLDMEQGSSLKNKYYRLHVKANTYLDEINSNVENLQTAANTKSD